MVTVAQDSIALSTRPPTPPKEHLEESTKPPNATGYRGTLGQQIFLETPDDSPSSSLECVNGSAGRLLKRVIFSPWINYHKALYPNGKSAITDITLRSLPPSKECLAMPKSILKVSTDSSSPATGFSQPWAIDPKDKLPAMLRSVSQHLAGASRISRIDAYRTVFSCLSKYEEVRDTQLLADNLAPFLEFLRRDVHAKLPETDTPDTELITGALKVLSVILYVRALLDATSDEFCTPIAEGAISALEKNQLPKIILDHHMNLLARQKLSPKILNTERATRILSVLKGIESRLKGNRVVGLKLMIYQRLLVQARSSMVSRAEEWLEFLIASMSSSIKDIRSRAIAFGTDAALALGTNNTVSQACLDILDGETPSGPKVVDRFGDRLREILIVKDEGVHVPQIWSVIILFLRARRRQIEWWEHLKGWLSIMERAFNSSDPKVKLQANLAWSRLAAALNLDVSTSASLIKVLRQPIASQLERKGSDKHLRHAKQLARSTYYTILYYAFRPGVSHEQLDLYWDSLISPVLTIKPSATASDHDFACEVLGAILSAPQARLWEQDRAYQVSPVKAHELPCLDPKWVRLRVDKIADLLENLLSHTNFARPGDARELPFFKTWQSFAKALEDAAVKEIKISMETITAVAHVISLLNRHASGGLEQYMSLLNEIVTRVGFRSFTEKRLLRAPSGRSFEAAETPSSRSGHQRGSLNSAVMYVMDALVNDRKSSSPQEIYCNTIHSILTIALRAANSRRRQLVVLQELATDVLSTSSSESGNRLQFWQCVATQCEGALSFVPSKLPESDDFQRRDQDYKEIIKVLELGVREFDVDLLPRWKGLSDSLMARIEKETSETAISLAYTEPLSKTIQPQEENGLIEYSDFTLRCASYLLVRAPWPRSRVDLEHARKLLWGVGPLLQRPVSFDPFEDLYTLAKSLLVSTYINVHDHSVGATTEFLYSVGGFLSSSPQPLKAICLKKLQGGLAMWIESTKVMASKSYSLTATVQAVWKASLAALESISNPSTVFLQSLEDLIVAGFSSRHMAVVNDMITTWNKTFGQADNLEYPAALRAILTKLRREVDLELPGFIDDEKTEISSSPFNFVASQEAETDVGIGVAQKSTYSVIHKPLLDGTAKVPGQHRARTALSPPPRSSPRQHKTTPRARLRHDNSQIQFAAIESSPLIPESPESQHLTHHQKEVKERQEQDAAAMFPDIRSSPRRPRSMERLPELILHGKATGQKALDADAEPSPTFPPGDPVMNDFLGSSPTPRSSRKGSLECPTTDGPASSPPASPSPQDAGSPNLPRTDSVECSPRSELANAVLSEDIHGEVAGNQHDEFACRSSAIEDITEASEHRVSEADLDSQSDADEYVDASQEPIENTDAGAEPSKDLKTTAPHEISHKAIEASGPPATPRKINDGKAEISHEVYTGNDSISLVEGSFHQESPYTPTEDEQARDQLLRDLEEASSQGDRQSTKRRPSVSSPSEKKGRKRRKQLSDDTMTSKKARVHPPAQSFEVVVEKRKPDQGDNEIIVIDDRIRSASPVVKRERSPSPVRDIYAPVANMIAPKMSHTGRRTRSMTRSSSSSAPELDDTSASTQYDKMDTNMIHGGGHGLELRPRKRQRKNYQEDTAKEQSTVRQGESELPPTVPSTGIEGDTTEGKSTITSSQMVCIKDLLVSHDDVPVQDKVRLTLSDGGGDTVPDTPRDGTPKQTAASASTQPPQAQLTPARSPGQRLLDRFRGLLNDLRQVTLWPQEEREIREMAFEIVRDVHEGGLRNGRRYSNH
ncbi:MAG: hypothetical protein Q9212_002197 [Teloschistes hypoglaucus]